jgi:integrase/recombinase XerD
MSTLATDLDRYLAIRRSLGYDLATAERVLRRFIGFARARKARHITTNLFLAWQAEFGQANQQTWFARLGMVRQFALWLNGIDPRNEVPPKALIPGRYCRAALYIYSEQEIARIVAEAARLPSPNGIRPLTFATLFGLIAATGLRVSEALALDIEDVDLECGVLTVRRSKSGKVRIVPLASSVTDRLAAYARERDRLLGRTPKSFFVSDVGNRPDDCSARYNFANVCQRIGLRSPQKFNRHGRGPRIHDLRHTFAARTMVDWYRSGKDPEREMIKLSTYLGHSEPEHTYWYIEAIPELLELAAQRSARALSRECGR